MASIEYINVAALSLLRRYVPDMIDAIADGEEAALLERYGEKIDRLVVAVIVARRLSGWWYRLDGVWRGPYFTRDDARLAAAVPGEAPDKAHKTAIEYIVMEELRNEPLRLGDDHIALYWHEGLPGWVDEMTCNAHGFHAPNPGECGDLVDATGQGYEVITIYEDESHGFYSPPDDGPWVKLFSIGGAGGERVCPFCVYGEALERDGEVQQPAPDDIAAPRCPVCDSTGMIYVGELSAVVLGRPTT